MAAILNEVTRDISPKVTQELWVLAGGRCQFRGHNELLYKSPVTQERVNRAQRAHIYSYSPNGARGRGPYARNAKGLNDTKNLLLVCHGCHQLIDADTDGKKYSAARLQEWKHEHECRITRVTGIAPHRKSHVVFYRTRIGAQDPAIDAEDAFSALFPDWYPADERPIDLSLPVEITDHEDSYWKTHADHLSRVFERKIAQLCADGHASHFSLFAFGDIPLLVRLGALFGDKVGVTTYQLKKDPRTWHHQKDAARGFRFRVKTPHTRTGIPVLVFSCSGKVSRDEVTKQVGKNAAVWEITASDCHNDFLRSRRQLRLFRETVRGVLEQITRHHGEKTVHVFPALPVSCAVELGRVRMPKLHAPWLIYDFNRKCAGYTPTLTIGDL